VLQGEVLILKGVAIDGLASSAIVVSEISSLGHLEGEKKKKERKKKKKRKNEKSSFDRSLPANASKDSQTA